MGTEKLGFETYDNVSEKHIQMCASNLFYFLKYVRTLDEDNKVYRNFPVHYEYLHNANRLVDEHKALVILKSRRLLISWWAVMRQLHQAMWAGTGIPGTHEAFRSGIMSVGEVEAMYLIERASQVYKMLPDWIKDLCPIVTDNKLFLEFGGGGKMQAFPMKREGPQTFGFSEVLFDEMALQEAARGTWVGMIPTLGAEGVIIAVSTPNGKQNFFYKVWKNEKNKFSGLKRLTIHWTENPEHNNKEWIETQRNKIGDDQAFARMYELSFAHSAGDRVFPGYDKKNEATSTRLIPNRPILFGWDFGYHYPACIIGQYNSLDQFIIHREVINYSIGFDEFCDEVKLKCEAIYDRDRFEELHFVDPAGFAKYDSKSRSGAMSNVEEIRIAFKRNQHEIVQVRPGAVAIGTKDIEGPRTKEIRNKLKLRSDGKAGMIVNKKCTELIDGFNGGYSFPEKGGDQPEKNEYSHPHDALQYLVTGFHRKFKYLKQDSKSPKRKRRSRIGHGTGI